MESMVVERPRLRRICTWCGKEFDVERKKRKRSLYCGDKCIDEKRRVEKEIKYGDPANTLPFKKRRSQYNERIKD